MAGTPSAGPANVTIHIQDKRFLPDALVVSAGALVVWIDDEEHEQHDVIAENRAFESSLLNPGDRFQHTFAASGVYPYYCSLHEGMLATITVQ